MAERNFFASIKKVDFVFSWKRFRGIFVSRAVTEIPIGIAAKETDIERNTVSSLLILAGYLLI